LVGFCKHGWILLKFGMHVSIEYGIIGKEIRSMKNPKLLNLSNKKKIGG
jgi:hypothetical protein